MENTIASNDRARRSGGELAAHVVDEYLSGRISRREFIRRGTVVGISIPMIAAVAGAGTSAASTRPAAAPRAPGGTIRVGLVTPTGQINPLTVADQGGLAMLAQTGEYLCLSDEHLRLRPVLATSWSANSAGDVWTFKIRRGVKFHDGRPLTADDVVYTYKLQTDPKGTANALSAFGGVLTPAGVTKVDAYTVRFHLDAPNGNFPYLCSSDNYNMIILPKGYDPARWQKSFIGTGPFTLTSYKPDVGAAFTRNPAYWGPKALVRTTQFTFYATQTPSIVALEGSTIDVVSQFSVQGGESLITGAYDVINLKSSAHRELSMRCDKAPFHDPRVRQALALTLDRPAIVKALFKGYAVPGNDSPFAPVFPSTDTSVAQRTMNLRKARQLLAAAGHPHGFTTKLYTENLLEIPAYAQIVKASAAKVGIDIALDVETSSAYYGKATFGSSDWLDGTMSLVDYGHRSVPNVFLTAPLESSGTWNAAHFKDASYDKLVTQYVAAVDLSTQRSLAGKIERLLLAETPVVFGYFYNYLTATTKRVKGVYPTAMGHLFLNNASIS